MRLTNSQTLPDDGQIIRMLDDLLFKDLEIDNFLEEDFFSWPSRHPAQAAALKIVRGLFSILQKYNLQSLSEDVLKSLYQELVDPETRHDLGEFYTPDWLAHRMVNRMLDFNPQAASLSEAEQKLTFQQKSFAMFRYGKRSRAGICGEEEFCQVPEMTFLLDLSITRDAVNIGSGSSAILDIVMRAPGEDGCRGWHNRMIQIFAAHGALVWGAGTLNCLPEIVIVGLPLSFLKVVITSRYELTYRAEAFTLVFG